jgi:L-threonylcarbamoyladenylate synthase
MRTEILPASDKKALELAVRLLKQGQVIAFPTDTVYGVGAHGLNEPAIERLFEAKGRPRERAIPFLLASSKDLGQVGREIPSDVKALAAKFWPGALTLVVLAHKRVPKILIAHGESVAVRVPNHEITRTIIQKLGAPLAATSANISSQPDPATAEQVAAYLNERIPLILDGGPTPGNIPSTVLDLTTEPPTVRRIGSVAVEEIELVLGRQVK